MYNYNDTMANEVIVKKWGNSLAIVIPRDIVKEKCLKENDKIAVEILKEADLSDIFGALKNKKKPMTGQEFKNFVRKGWH